MRWLLLLLLVLSAGCEKPTLTLPAPPLRAGGQPVNYEHRYNMAGDMAAQWRAGIPVLYFHPERFELLEPELKYFILGHEYCHLLEPGRGEISADCCGLAWMKGAELDGGQTLVKIVSFVQTWPESEVHPPGSLRAAAIMGCSFALAFD